MTTLQQLLLYMLLALFLPRTTSELRSEKIVRSEHRKQLIRLSKAYFNENVDTIVRENLEKSREFKGLQAKASEDRRDRALREVKESEEKKNERDVYTTPYKTNEKIMEKEINNQEEKAQEKAEEKLKEKRRKSTVETTEIGMKKESKKRSLRTDRERRINTERDNLLEIKEKIKSEITIQNAMHSNKSREYSTYKFAENLKTINSTLRTKRQPQSSTLSRPLSQTKQQMRALQSQLALPAVPLPAPPPSAYDSLFSPSLAISPFRSSTPSKFPNAFESSALTAPKSAAAPSCGGLLTQRRGIIHTPNFPRKFSVPIECVWIIDASELTASVAANVASPSSNVTIVVYLTQLYVLGGLTFTEYMYYSDDFKVPAHHAVRLNEDDVTQVASVQFSSQYLEIRFGMSSLDGTHLRALDRLLDVYGFNITYEIFSEVKAYQCNTLQCRFLGHCYARADFSSYYCACFAGFSGSDCGRGPLCKDPYTNICQNGGACKHIGDAAITCHCPAGFRGTKCEIPEISEITMGCTVNSTSSDCHQECNFKYAPTNALSRNEVGRALARSGKTRYEVTIRLGTNLPSFYRTADGDRRPGDHLPSLLERHLSRILRNFNITKISDLELISNSTDRLDITFHFFGLKSDSLRIREAITRMVERGRIGNVTLIANYHLFDENPPLHLLDVAINQKPMIREGSEFILSCTAQGSSRMQFHWFKDGAVVNASKSIREIWTTVLPPETEDVYTAILGITKASRTDDGIYTCKVSDWGIEQCRSLHVHVRTPPRLRVDPASVTLNRGDSLRVRCLSPGTDDIKRYAQFGYSWTRNGQLFQSDPATVMWEDLYPDGSILKINNIQRSAEYSCVVSNSVHPVSKSVYITVVDRNAVQLCRSEEGVHGVRWPNSAPGAAAIISECPPGYEGYSRRVCEKRDMGNSSWLQADFSNCIADQMWKIYNKFQALKSGFQQTNSSGILKECFDYANRRRKTFLPGEAGFLIDLLQEVDSYLQLKGTQLEREMAAEIILHILDKVMQNSVSLNSQQQIKKLQLLTQSAALNRETIAASQLATSTSSAAAAAATSSSSSSLSSVSASSSSAAAVLIASTADASPAAAFAPSSASSSTPSSLKTGSKHQIAATTLPKSGEAVARRSGNSASGVVAVDADSLSLDRLRSLRIYMTAVKTLPFNLRIYGDDLFSDQLYIDIGLSSRLLSVMTNSTIFASVISYKNLKSFLPKTYYTCGSDARDADYVLASRIIQTWLFQSNRSNDNLRLPLDLPFEAGHVEIIFQHESVRKDTEWLPVCGHDYKASFESTWRSDLCVTKNLMENITRCTCPLSGTYVVMLTKRNFNSSMPRPPQRPVFIIISCGCCLLQSCTAFAILLPVWYNRKCALTFLKMQFCVSVSCMMLILLLGFLKMLPVDVQPIVSSSLASLLLFSISTLVAIALVIHLQTLPRKFLHHQHVTTNATTAALVGNKQQMQPPEKHRSASLTNLNDNNIAAIQQQQQQQQHLKSQRSSGSNNSSNLSASSVNGSIAISWLLPLLFAISSPLICSIIGKWPENWWLDVMASLPTATTAAADSSSYGEATRGTADSGDSNFNGDNLFESVINKNAPTTVASTTSTTISTTTTRTAEISSSITTTMSLFSPSTAMRMTTTSLDRNGSNILSAANLSEALKQATTATTTTTTATTTTATTTTAIQEVPTLAPSLIFIIFIVIDLFLVLLFVALVMTLTKKLLWLLRKHQQPHPHPLGKFNMAVGRRIGLLYRSALLLCIKITTDALFITYMNSKEDSWWSYAFGVSSMLLGCSILFCFVIKAECEIRSSYSGRNGSTGTLKTKLSSSKTSLDESYCTGAINSSLSFYTNQDKEKDNDCGAPTPLTTILAAPGRHPASQTLPPSSVQLPLTIISAAPRCQMLTGNLREQTGSVGGCSVDAFRGGSLERKGCLQQQHQQPPHLPPTKEKLRKVHLAGGVGGATEAATAFASAAMVASPASRCCSILSGGSSNSTACNANLKPSSADDILSGESSLSSPAWQKHSVGSMSAAAPGSNAGVLYYDLYMGGNSSSSSSMGGNMTGSLGRKHLQQCQLQKQQQQEFYLQQPLQQLHIEGQQEFVGVENLDILQGVAPDSIIGIRNKFLPSILVNIASNKSSAAPSTGCTNSKIFSHSNMNLINATTTTTNSSSNTNTIATNSVMTQTPKSQKRVTILEPTTHTFDPLLPTMTAAGGATMGTATATANESHHKLPPVMNPRTPTITITCPSLDETATTAAMATTDNSHSASASNHSATPSSVSSSTSSVGVALSSTADANLRVTLDDGDENSISGMFDRISHDLDYLLNRTNELPPLSDAPDDALPPPPLPPSGSKPVESPTRVRASLKHEVIIEEESEQE